MIRRPGSWAVEGGAGGSAAFLPLPFAGRGRACLGGLIHAGPRTLACGDDLLLVRGVAGRQRTTGPRGMPAPTALPASSAAPSGRITRMKGASMTGGAASMGAVESMGAVTTRSSDGFSSPPSADQTSAMDRSEGGGSAMVVSSGSDVSSSDPVRTSAGRTG